MKNEAAKAVFARQLKEFAQTLGAFIAKGDEWTIRGFIDIFKNIYTISTDTKIVSKVLELHLFPHFLTFAENIGYTIELATYQNWYPDLTFISKADPTIKFAVDLKTTYRDEECPGFCNGFTLGSHGEYFIERTSTKNIQYPYDEYCGHFCLGIILLYIQEPILAKMKKLISILLMKLRESPPLFGIFCSLQKKSGKLQVIKAEVAILQTSAAFRKLMIY